MTLERLEQRVTELERQVAELRRERKPLKPLKRVVDSFAMFANDRQFDEIVRLGRQFREQANGRD